MNPGLEYYRPFGQPATGLITIKKKPPAATTITIDGTVYTYGVDFVGDEPLGVALSLTAVINSDRNRQTFSPGALQNPIKSVFAIYYGNKIEVIATAPGVSGNSITLSTSDATVFTVPATLGSGAAGSSILATTSPLLTPTTLNTFLVTNPDHTLAKRLIVTSTLFVTATLVAIKSQSPWTPNVGNVYLTLSNNITTQLFPIFSGGTFAIEAPPGQTYNLNQFYFNSDNDNDGIGVMYS